MEIKCIAYRYFEEEEVNCYLLRSMLTNMFYEWLGELFHLDYTVTTLVEDVVERFSRLPYCMYEAVGCKGLPMTYKLIWDKRCVVAGVAAQGTRTRRKLFRNHLLRQRRWRRDFRQLCGLGCAVGR
jgi:hypothetical protein